MLRDPPMKKPIFVTGAAGFIGSHLCEALLRQGHKVVGIDNFNDFYAPALKRKNLVDIQKTASLTKTSFECIKGDILDADKLGTIFDTHKPDLIVHLAGMAGVRPSTQNPLLYEKVNGLGTLTLLEVARQKKILKMVFGSSSSVYGLNTKVPFSESDPVEQPFSPYAQTKRSNELQCHVYHKLYDMTVACLRFFTVYGPRQRPDLAIRKFSENIQAGRPITVFGDGSAKRDFTYVDDIIDGVVKSIDWVNKESTPRFDIFNLGESATTTVIDLIKLIESAIGKKAELAFNPPIPGDVPITFADISKAKKVLGYNPQTDLEVGIPRFMEWFLAQK